MKYTLLDLVQLIASSMDSDEINSISDSTESMQIANVVRTTYFDIIGRSNLPEHQTPFNLEASTDSSKPVLMTVPDTLSKVLWVKYNKILETDDPINMEVVTFLPWDLFSQRQERLSTDEDNVGSFEQMVNGTDTVTINYQTDRQPTYYTTFDDVTLIFDSYDSDIESTLQRSNTECYGKKIIPWSMTDTFVPTLDDEQFGLLVNEAKSLAWAELRQTSHAIAERNSRRQWTHLQSTKNRTEKQSDFDKFPYFGRK